MDPLVTVSILNYKRREALERVLESVFAQDYPAFEVIVVDNASGDGVAGFLKTRFPRVRLIDLLENIGTPARNHGIRAARGEIIITLDNDVYLDSPNEIRHVVEAFDRHAGAACIAFRVYHPATGRLHARDWCHPRPWTVAECSEFETHYITEGASAFRRAVFESVEPYWADLFIAHEGYDLSLRLLEAGYQIWYAPAVKVWHMASLETRETWRPFYWNARGLLMVSWRDYPLLAGIRFMVPRYAVLAFYAVKRGYLQHLLRGTIDGVRQSMRLRHLRKPIRSDTLKKLRGLRKDQPGIFARFRRHWKKTEF